MDWFRDAIIQYFRNQPRLTVGYLDLFDNQSSCSYKDTPLEKKVSCENIQREMLENELAKPFPLWENGIFQRGVICDFDPVVLDHMLCAGLINSSYVYSGRPKAKKRQVKAEIQESLKKIYEKYEGLILPLFE